MGTKTPAERLRVFYALWPGAAVAERLAALGAAHVPPTARRMRADTVHLTLAFVGDITPDRLPDVMAAGDAVSWPHVELSVDRLAHWPHNGIVWAGVSNVPAALIQLADDLSEALRLRGLSMPDRGFTPHITLARKVDAFSPATEVPPIDWHVDGGVLVQSRRDQAGSRYHVLRCWPAGSAE